MKKYLNKKVPKTIRKKLWDIKGESSSILSEYLPVSYVQKLDKFFLEDDKLLPNPTINPAYEYGVLDLGEPINKITAYYRALDENCIFVTASGTYNIGYYFTGIEKALLTTEKLIYGLPYFFEGNHLILLSSFTNKKLYKFDGEVLTPYALDFRLKRFCNHFGRVFAISDDYLIRFSDDLDPFNWNISITEGGYIEFNANLGMVMDLVSFNQHLYVFFDYGLMRITAYGDQSEFSVKPVNIGTGNVVANTMCNAGDRLIFLSTNGLNIYDGYSHKILFPELAEDLKEAEGEAVFLDNKYYLLLRKKPYDTANKLIIYDLLQNNYSVIHDAPGNKLALVGLRVIKDVAVYQSRTYQEEVKDSYPLYYLNKDYKEELRQIVTNDLDFGYPTKNKLLKSYTNGGGVAVTLTLTVDDTLYVYDLDANSCRQINLKGKNFRFDVTSLNLNGTLLPPIVEYQILGEI